MLQKYWELDLFSLWPIFIIFPITPHVVKYQTKEPVNTTLLSFGTSALLVNSWQLTFFLYLYCIWEVYYKFSLILVQFDVLVAAIPLSDGDDEAAQLKRIAELQVWCNLLCCWLDDIYCQDTLAYHLFQKTNREDQLPKIVLL